MTRTMTMYDGVDAASVPSGAAIYAGYVDGEWKSFDALVAEYPSALHVSICVTSSDSARVLDVESGDATPDEAPGWASAQRAGGNPYPVVYMSESNWSAVKTAFSNQGVAAPLYWVADYVDDPSTVPSIPDGAIALQYYDYGGYDASVAADYWPGLDSAPVTTSSSEDEDDDMNTTSSSTGRAGLTWAAGSRHVVQVGYDPSGGNPELRLLLTLTTGPWVAPAAMTFPAGSGTGDYEIPSEYIATCRGVILEWLAGSPKVVYDVTAV
jgi:hypothetical protein